MAAANLNSQFPNLLSVEYFNGHGHAAHSSYEN